MQNEIRNLLLEHGLTPNKALGQNFLVDKRALETILDGAKIDRAPVLEIGPGLGSLTKGLLERAARVAAVEIDEAMVRILRERFDKDLHFYLLHADFLKADLAPVLDFLGGEFHVAANLPYYVTSPIAMRLLSSALPIRSMTLMLQKEAAERFSARPKDRVYGPLSILSQAYYSVSTLTSLSPACYYPQPQVDSVVIHMERKEQEELFGFDKFLETAFHMRRKTLLNNLKALGYTASDIEACGISPTDRAESLSVEEHLRLFQSRRV